MNTKKTISNKKVLINTLKIGLAAIVAILLASLLKLEFSVSAGIVAILSVAPTKKETIRTATGRLIAFLIALVISFVCFNLIGFNIYSFFIYLIIFIAICQKFGWLSAMAMDSVLISHFLSLGNMNMNSVINEVLLFAVGVTCGIVVNLHLKKNVTKIEGMKDDLDDQIRHILMRMSQRVLDKNLPNYDGRCLDELWDTIARAEKQASKNELNEFTPDPTDRNYIAMRRRQAAVLMEMYKKCRSLEASPETARSISQFLQKTSEEYSRDNTVEDLTHELQTLISSMKEYELPQTRDEFEDRATLYALLMDLKEFLSIKQEFMLSKEQK